MNKKAIASEVIVHFISYIFLLFSLFVFVFYFKACGTVTSNTIEDTPLDAEIASTNSIIFLRNPTDYQLYQTDIHNALLWSSLQKNNDAEQMLQKIKDKTGFYTYIDIGTVYDFRTQNTQTQTPCQSLSITGFSNTIVGKACAEKNH